VPVVPEGGLQTADAPVTAAVPTLRVAPLRSPRVGSAAAVRSGLAPRAARAARAALLTVRICLRHRVTGLAAEAGFFALLSLPPLVLGLVACAGYVGPGIDRDVLSALRGRLQDLAATFLTPEAVHAVILPTFDEVVGAGRPDVVSLGFLLSVWSGSRALHVFVDTVAIMYGHGGRRGIVRTRALSFSLYVLALVLGVVTIPLVLLGPGLLGDLAGAVVGPERLQGPPVGWVAVLYWPVVTVLTVAGLATLYHVASPVRTSWRRDLPGAAVALGIWLLASVVLREVLTASVAGTSIYGPLSAPIVLLIWLYSLAIAVLVGAAANAALDDLRPPAPEKGDDRGDRAT
jgi:membrane protein